MRADKPALVGVLTSVGPSGRSVLKVRGSGVRLKWGDKLENGKGVVADANPPRTMPFQSTLPQTASHAPLYAILAYSPLGLPGATRGA